MRGTVTVKDSVEVQSISVLSCLSMPGDFSVVVFKLIRLYFFLNFKLVYARLDMHCRCLFSLPIKSSYSEGRIRLSGMKSTTVISIFILAI